VGFSFAGIELTDLADYYGMGPWIIVPLNSSGVATFTTSSFDGTQVPVIAHYLGDANNAPSNGSMTEILTPIGTVTTLTSSANSVPYATPVVFTATALDNTGAPVQGGVLFQTGSQAIARVSVDGTGHATWVNGDAGYFLPVGANNMTATFIPSPTGYQQSSASVIETFTSLGVTPPPTFAPAAGVYSSNQQVVLNDSMNSAAIYYTTNGTTPAVGSAIPFQAGFTIPVDATETIQALAVAPGYSPSSVASAAYTINLPPPSFTIAATAVSLTPGATTGNTSTISVTPSGGFAGSVALTATVSSSPSGAAYPPTLSFGSNSPVNITGTTAETAVLSIYTTAPASSALSYPKRHGVSWHTAGGTALACLLIFGIRARRRNGRTMLGMLIFLVAFIGSLLACSGGGASGGGGGGNPGTTPGNYSITVTGTSGTITETRSVTLTVQ